MRKIIFFTYSLILVCSLQCVANTNMMYDKANQLYHNKNYDSAVTLYQQMINDGFCAADLFYNAGNAYYRTNKIGMSIWCFEKALQLDHNKNYDDNLALAKKRIKDPIEEVKEIFFIRWWESMYQLFTPNGWAVLALISFLISFTLLFIKKWRPAISISSYMNGVLFFITAWSLLMLAVNVYQKTYHYKAIVIEPKTMFMFSSKREPIFLSEGIKVSVVNTNINKRFQGAADYIEVELPDGRKGRIDRKSIKKL